MHYFNSRKKVNRVAESTCLLLVLRSRALVPTNQGEYERFTLEWATSKEILESWDSLNKNKDYDHWIYFLEKAVKRVAELGYDKTNI